MLQLKIFNIDKLNNEDLFYAYYSDMSSVRKNKIDRCRQENDKKRSLGVGILIDEFLQGYNLREKDIEYRTNESGKPYFEEFYFNASHSGKYAVCAFSDKEVGCDIEVSGKKNLCVAKRFFTEEEQNYIFNKSIEDVIANKRFVRLWTLKESYLKYLGVGLTKSLSSFSIRNLSEDGDRLILDFDAGRYEKNVQCENTRKSKVTIVDEGRNVNCCFYEFNLLDSYISICTR